MSRRKNEEVDALPRRPPARTDEDRENQLIALAYDVAEERLRNKTASSQEVTHFLKLGSSNEKLQQRKLAMEIELGEVKKQTLESAARVEEMMKDALGAFKVYAGAGKIADDQNS